MIGEYKLNEIYNEDSYEAIKKIPDNSVDLVIIDPPYNFTSGGDGIFKDRKTNFYKELEEKKLKHNFDLSILDELKRIMKNVNIYIWCSKLQIKQYLDYFDNNNYSFEILIWQKTNPIPMFNNCYITDKEYCLFFRERIKTKLNCTVGSARTVYTTKCNKNDKDSFNHPTIKPLEIIKNLIVNSSNENDIVADFFLGSGTTCVAAKELNRRYIGFEIDKDFYKIAKDRLNGITANGQTSIFTDFEQLGSDIQ